MDWNLAIERNHAALGRIVAMLVAMAGLASLTSPLAGEDGSARRGEAEALAEPGEGCFSPAPTLPRHLHRAILRLLRPAESAVRRLVIVMARGLVVTLAPPRPRKAKPASTFLRKPGGTGIHIPASARVSGSPSPLWGGVRGGGATARTLALPMLDPLRPFRPRPKRPVANGIPRISLPGVTAPFPVAPRRPPAPDDPLDATRLALRLQALGAALDDLPGQASRFARWRARGERMPRPQTKNSTPAVLAASGRCVRAARPANALPTGAPTRCTRSCTTSTASPSTCWSIPTRPDAYPLPHEGGGEVARPKGRDGEGGRP